MTPNTPIARLKVLIAESDTLDRLLYSMGMPDLLFEKRFVSNDKDAMEAYKTHQPDIVVLGNLRPEESEVSVLKRLRKELGDTTTCILMATSISEKRTVMDCLRLGIQGFIVKPFTHERIVQWVLECYEKVNPQRTAALMTLLESETADLVVLD